MLPVRWDGDRCGRVPPAGALPSASARAAAEDGTNSMCVNQNGQNSIVKILLNFLNEVSRS